MTDNITLIGCHRGNRVKSRCLFSSLSKFNRDYLRPVLNPKQIEKIKLLYTDEKIKYKTNSSAGGLFGIYFNVIPHWNKQKNKLYFEERGIRYLAAYNKCCYYYNAKKLIIKIVNDMINRSIFLENMIYFNKTHNNGKVDRETVKFIFTDKQNIENDVNTFLLEVKDLAAWNQPNELVIKWLIPKTPEYGFIRRGRNLNNNSLNGPCYNNKKNNLSNEDFLNKYGSRNIANIENKIYNNHGNSHIVKKWINTMQKIYKEQLNNYEKILKKANKTNSNIAKINEFEELQKMLKYITNHGGDYEGVYELIEEKYNRMSDYERKLDQVRNLLIEKIIKNSNNQKIQNRLNNLDLAYVKRYGLSRLLIEKINKLYIGRLFYPFDILKIIYAKYMDTSDFSELYKKYDEKMHEDFINTIVKISNYSPFIQ